MRQRLASSRSFSSAIQISVWCMASSRSPCSVQIPFPQSVGTSRALEMCHSTKSPSSKMALLMKILVLVVVDALQGRELLFDPLPASCSERHPLGLKYKLSL